MTIFIGLLCLVLSGLALFAAAYRDVKEFHIPNYTSLVIAASFCLFAAFSLSPIEIIFHVCVAAIIFALTFMLYMKNAFGAGDVKLISALSLWAGATTIMPFLFAVSLFGGMLALLIIICRKNKSLHTHIHNKKMKSLMNWIKTRQEVPYGVAIACGGLVILQDRLVFILS